MSTRPKQKGIDTQGERRPLSLSERLALIGLISEGLGPDKSDSPMADLFAELGTLVRTTVAGAKIDPWKNDESTSGFKVLEMTAESGETLGSLNLLYLKKPIPCYYLAYVEIAAPYRNQGLGARILSAFRAFLVQKNAVGLLDNIIPENDPTYDVYVKLDWRPAKKVIGAAIDGDGVYMMYIPPALANKDLRDPALRVIHHLKRKRAAIDMRDNAIMVQRTIEEFKALYEALLVYFDELRWQSENEALMRYMFTRFATRLMGFRRRIAALVGFTGGESLEQLSLDGRIRSFVVQSYAPKVIAGDTGLVSGDPALWLCLPEALKQNPAGEIERLPHYHSPRFRNWLLDNGRSPDAPLTIGDLLHLGYDPSRFKEIDVDGERYIIERAQARLLDELLRRKEHLETVNAQAELFVAGVPIKSNPIVLIVRDRGNIYVMRRRIPAIPWNEALEQMQTAPKLKRLDQSIRFTSTLKKLLRKAQSGEISHGSAGQNSCETPAYFVSWNLDGNRPLTVVENDGAKPAALWLT